MSETSTAKSTPRRVLVTGAAGRIGSYFCQSSHTRYQLRMMTLPNDPKAADLHAFGEVVEADLADLAALGRAMQGIDTVIHLAGNPSASAKWDDLLQTNIIGTYNVFVAAKAAGCRRVIYASSIHAVSGGAVDVQVKPNEPVNPGDIYGVSKCFGEALARYMAEQEGLSGIAIRIGAFQSVDFVDSEKAIRMMDAWVSDRDLAQLICRCIDVENLKFAIFHGVSDNQFKRLDISNARELVGYAPVDDSAQEIPRLKPLHLEKIPGHNAHDPSTKSGIREDLTKTES